MAARMRVADLLLGFRDRWATRRYPECYISFKSRAATSRPRRAPPPPTAGMWGAACLCAGFRHPCGAHGPENHLA